jgi:hypothetical protein
MSICVSHFRANCLICIKLNTKFATLNLLQFHVVFFFNWRSSNLGNTVTGYVSTASLLFPLISLVFISSRPLPCLHY